MKEITDKKALRNEKKKKKMFAEIELYNLKTKDKETNDASKRDRKLFNEFEELSNNITDGKSEPKPKRKKKDNEQFASHLNDYHTSVSNSNATTNYATETNYTILSNSNILLDGEELAKLRQALRERKKILKNLPRLRLRNAGECADLSQVTKRTPLFLSDIQHLLMYSQLGQHSPYDPRWAVLEKCSSVSHTLFILVEGASVYDYITTESACPNLAKMDVRVELVSPFKYSGSIVEEICAVPLSKTQKSKLERKFGNLNDALQSSDKVFRVLRSMFPIKHIGLRPPKTNNGQPELPSTDAFSRTELLLSAWQLVEEGYPLPLQGELSTRYSSYTLTKDEYSEVTPQSPMWAIDCEMCQTAHGSELTRVSIVNEDMQVMYETLVKPYNRIINYLTHYSGITRQMLTDVTKRLEDVQADLRELLPPDVILVGQSLNFDLHALKMMHPYIIDTSVIYNLSGERHRKSKLAVLSSIFLREVIQARSSGHDSVEDSSASMKLVKLKLKNSIEYGDAVLCGIHAANRGSIFKNNTKGNEQSQNSEYNLATSLFSHVTSQKKIVSLISSDQTMSEYTPFITAATFGIEEYTKVECEVTNTNLEAIEKTLEVISKNQFCLTHLQLNENESVADIDQWTSQLLKNSINNSLVIIVLAGSPTSSSNGAAFLHIQRPRVSPRTGLMTDF